MATVKNKLEELSVNKEEGAGFFSSKALNLLAEFESNSIQKSEFLLKLNSLLMEVQRARFTIRKKELLSLIEEIKQS